MSKIAIATSQHTLQGYLQVPVGSGPWPGVVVLHDIFGQTEDSRRQVDWLADAGYLALAPDLFSWGSTPRCLVSLFRNMVARKGFAFEAIEASREVLATHSECSGKVAVIGFCMGGGFALLAATKGEFQASSVNYGMVPKDSDELLKSACPIIGSFGAHDPALKGAAAHLEHSLQKNNIVHDVKEYPSVGHGFMNEHSGFQGWLVARLGMTFDGPAANDARMRILEFFQTHLH